MICIIKYHNVNEGFFGFFECIDNQEVANALLMRQKTGLRKKD
jgi:hypothetical protein